VFVPPLCLMMVAMDHELDALERFKTGSAGAEQMTAPAYTGIEIEITPIGLPSRRSGPQSAIGGDVDGFSGGQIHCIDIERRTALHLLGNDEAQAFQASIADTRTVRLERRSAVVETVIGEPLDLSLQIDDPQIGALIDVGVALMRIGSEDEFQAIGAPGVIFDVDVQ